MIYNYDSLNFNVLTVEQIAHSSRKYSVKARPYAAISFRISGDSIFKIDGKTFTANAGDVVFIPANLPYEVDYSFSKIIVVHLLDCNYFEAECIKPQNMKIEALFKEMLESWKNYKSTNKVKACLYEILHRLEESQNANNQRRPAEFEHCLSYLEEHFSDSSLKIETLCNLTYISRSSLQRYFLRFLGVHPKQYLLQLRLNKAFDLLASDNKTVSEIAETCGFSDEKYFSRVFKQNYGISPRDARHRTHI